MNLINSNINLSKYKHVSYKKRIKIETYLDQGMSVSRIARLLNRSRATIYKEIKYGTTTQIKQNKKKLMYLADTSQAIYERNRRILLRYFRYLILSIMFTINFTIAASLLMHSAKQLI